jgi:hypothetical protein
MKVSFVTLFYWLISRINKLTRNFPQFAEMRKRKRKRASTRKASENQQESRKTLSNDKQSDAGRKKGRLL